MFRVLIVDATTPHEGDSEAKRLYLRHLGFSDEVELTFAQNMAEALHVAHSMTAIDLVVIEGEIPLWISGVETYSPKALLLEMRQGITEYHGPVVLFQPSREEANGVSDADIASIQEASFSVHLVSASGLSADWQALRGVVEGILDQL